MLVLPVNSLLLEQQLHAQLVLITIARLVPHPQLIHALSVRTLTSIPHLPILVKLHATLLIVLPAHPIKPLVLHVSLTTLSLVVVPVPNVLEILGLMVHKVHAKLVMLTAPLVPVLQLHARLVPLVNSYPAQHVPPAILDVLLVLEKELAQHVPLIIT